MFVNDADALSSPHTTTEAPTNTAISTDYK